MVVSSTYSNKLAAVSSCFVFVSVLFCHVAIKMMLNNSPTLNVNLFRTHYVTISLHRIADVALFRNHSYVFASK